jgi:type I restriction enzyme, R subunit
MATGSGKGLTAVVQVYWLIKFGGARRVLSLVDRSNLGELEEGEFKNYRMLIDGHHEVDYYGPWRRTA